MADLASIVIAHPLASAGVAVAVGVVGMKLLTGAGPGTFATNSGKTTEVSTDPGLGYVSNDMLLAALRDERQAILDEMARQFTYWGGAGSASAGTLHPVSPPGPIDPPSMGDPPSGPGDGRDLFGPAGSGEHYRAGVINDALRAMGVY